MTVIDRQLEIHLLNGDHNKITDNKITASNIIAESMVLERSICDDEFKLGGCIASSFELQLIGIPPDEVQNKRIQVVAIEKFPTTDPIYPFATLSPSYNIAPGSKRIGQRTRKLFTGTIDSAKRQKNRQIVKIIAFDDLYLLGNKNVYTWFSGFAQYSGTETLATLLDSLFNSQLIDLPYINRYIMTNGNYNVPLSLSSALVKSEFTGTITVGEILRSANELLGCFGYITAEGKYRAIGITGNTDDTAVEITTYEDLEFEEYVTQVIDGVALQYNSNERAFVGRSSSYAHPSCYVSDDNAIARCCTDYDSTIALVLNMANTELGKLTDTVYRFRPYTLKINDNFTEGISLGTRLKIATGLASDDVQTVYSFVFADKMTGIQNLTHEYTASGDMVLQGYDNETKGASI